MKHLKKWMKPSRRRVAWYMQIAKARVNYEPKGVVGIIVPWNYPLQLALSPLVAAIAAGNFCILKMSEYSPHFGALFEKLITENFLQKEITVINGDVELAKQFSALAFDHLFFTGSSVVGKLVMRAASENLTPVTLELGGKSPTIISRNCSLKKAVNSIIHTKMLNAGQTCVAPDYVFLPEELKDDFIALAKSAFTKLYPNFANNNEFSCINNQAATTRLQNLLNDASDNAAERIAL